MSSKVVVEFSTTKAKVVNAGFMQLAGCSDPKALQPFLVAMQKEPDLQGWGTEIARLCKPGMVCCASGNGWMFCMNAFSFIITTNARKGWDVWIGLGGIHCDDAPDAVLKMQEQDPTMEIVTNLTTQKAASQHASAVSVA